MNVTETISSTNGVISRLIELLEVRFIIDLRANHLRNDLLLNRV